MPMREIARPLPDEYAPYFEYYLRHVAPDADVLGVLAGQATTLSGLVSALTPAQAEHRYAPGKWSVKQVLAHLADTERVFVFRALWFARGETAALPGMDENLWGETAGADARKVADLGAELDLLRRHSLALFAALPAEAWDRRGVASERVLSVRAVPWILAGHERHHLEILRERYGVG
jgi:hypothetical protein